MVASTPEQQLGEDCMIFRNCTLRSRCQDKEKNDLQQKEESKLKTLRQVLRTPLQRFGKHAEKTFHSDPGDKEHTLLLQEIRRIMFSKHEKWRLKGDGITMYKHLPEKKQGFPEVLFNLARKGIILNYLMVANARENEIESTNLHHDSH